MGTRSPRQPSPRSRANARLDDFRAGVYAVALGSEEWRSRPSTFLLDIGSRQSMYNTDPLTTTPKAG